MGPAVTVGGRRRRNTRRSNTKRSTTTPNLGLDSPAATENASGVTAGLSTEHVEYLPVSPSFQPSNPMVNHYAPNSGPSGYRGRSPTSCPSDGLSSMPVAQSPTPTTEIASTTATEGKKKHGKFSFKSKNQDRPASSHEPTHQASPLPPLTPVKAAKFLGVDAGPIRVRSNSEGRQPQHNGSGGGPPVLPPSTWQASPLVPSSSKGAPSRQTKFKEEGLDPDPSKVKSFWANSNRKAQKMLGLLPSVASSSKREIDMERTAVVSLERRTEDDTDTYYSGDSELHEHPRLLHPAARKAPETPPKRRTRKKVSKSLDRMAPITETSHDELRSSYQVSEQNPELGVISEYELEEDDLSPSDQVIRENDGDEEEHFTAHPGQQVDANHVGDHQATVFRLRGPLQTVEDRLLDEAEAQLAISRARQNENDATRLRLDTQYATLKASNEIMKTQFAAAKQSVASEERERFDGADSEDDEDLVSISSSIDIDEEPTVHVAEVMTFTRITPGMVKLVDIPPRKKPAVPAAPLPMLASSTQMEAPSKPAGTFFFQHDERISPFNERSEHVEPTAMTGHLTARGYSRLDKDKKPKMPHDDSRLLVQDWMSTYDHAKQLPVSERIDPDVLADQQIPPAPLPKDDCSVPLHPPSRRSPHPPRSSSKEHYCLKNGHIFHPINLKTVPDEVAINSLEVRPYLHTAVGYKQHVSVPVFCDRCGEDVKEELWECDIAICRMGVCKKCAEDMEHEWQERVTDAWTR
ncbi:hypothetical protein ACET3X_000266 [Alternaria dauci]|uniref:Uncharacterized protein n=1 Tax=Alternaria dauci TaxID=48095 RepID=A0ABR3UWA2_9PLEO